MLVAEGLPAAPFFSQSACSGCKNLPEFAHQIKTKPLETAFTRSLNGCAQAAAGTQ
jgi:hypothetical protein